MPFPRPGLRQMTQAFMGGTPEDVANDEPAGISSLVDRTRGAISGANLGVQAPTQESPETPDLGVLAQSRKDLGLTRMVQGFTGVVPVTSYNSKQGVHAGMAMNSPSDKAAQQAAVDPWLQEQARVQNANTMHAFNNQYSKMKTDADNQTTQRALDLAQTQMVSAGARGYYKNLFGAADQDRALKGREIDMKGRILDANLGFKSRAAERADTQLGINQQRAAQATETHGKQMAAVPDTAMAIVGHGDAADESLRRLDELIRNEPDASSLINKTLTWHDIAISNDPLARRINMLRNESLENLTQFQRRRTNQEGSSTLSHVLTMFGDQGTPRDLTEGIGMLRGRLYNMIKMEEGAHPTLKSRPGMPHDTSGLPGGSDIDAELNKRGIK